MAAKPEARALLFIGESSLTDPAVRAAIAAVVPLERQPLDLDVLRWPEHPLGDACRALCQVGMFAAGRAVWVRGYAPSARAAESEEEESEEPADTGGDTAALLALVESGVSAGSLLVISGPSIDRRTRLYRTFDRHGAVIDLRIDTAAKKGAVPSQRLAALVRERLLSHGLREVPTAALTEILRRASPNVGELLQELDRLALALPEGGPLGLGAVREIMRDAAEAWVFDLTDAIGTRQLAAAERTLVRLLGAGEPPLRLVAVLGTHLASLIEAADAAASLEGSVRTLSMDEFARRHLGRLPQEFRSRYSPGRAYHLLRAAGAFSPAELRRLHREILALDLALKSSPVRPMLLLERFLQSACTAAGATGAAGHPH